MSTNTESAAWAQVGQPITQTVYEGTVAGWVIRLEFDSGDSSVWVKFARKLNGLEISASLTLYATTLEAAMRWASEWAESACVGEVADA